MTALQSVAALGADRDAALAAGDVPSLAIIAAKLRGQRALYRAAHTDPKAVETIDAMCRALNQALADRLVFDVENAERRVTEFPVEYLRFASELARDDACFDSLAHRVASTYVQLHGAPAAGATPDDMGEEGD